MKKKTVSFTDARMSLRENKTHKSIHIWSYSLYERVISVQVKKQGWLTSFHQCRTDLVDSRNNLSSNSLFNWLYTAALLPELKPAPCFLSAILGHTWL